MDASCIKNIAQADGNSVEEYIKYPFDYFGAEGEGLGGIPDANNPVGLKIYKCDDDDIALSAYVFSAYG